MAQIIWFNQPTNHSGTVNYLYLDPDGDVGDFTADEADGGGPYILGGPVLSHDGFRLTDAALTLISLLPAGFHVFPKESTEQIRETIGANRQEISDKSPTIDEDEWAMRVYAKAYTTTQCCDLFLNNTPPTSAIVFVDYDEEGMADLGIALARIYYSLPKERRTELDLKADWSHHIQT